MKLVGWEIQANSGMRVEPASQKRAWMEEQNRFGYRCLPMVVANQHGWVVTNARTFTATWNGGQAPSDVQLEGEPMGVQSHFGQGIITWSIPWLFRTPRGWNLVTRGVPNLPKDGATSLEGLVETDWAVATFTHNWMLTRPGHPVTFAQDEPIAFIYPTRRGDLQRFTPELVSFADAPATVQHQYRGWDQSRQRFNADPARGDRWERHYYQGKGPAGGRPVKGQRHETKIVLAPFTDNRRSM
jgi:hypothetical protein